VVPDDGVSMGKYCGCGPGGGGIGGSSPGEGWLGEYCILSSVVKGDGTAGGVYHPSSPPGGGPPGDGGNHGCVGESGGSDSAAMLDMSSMFGNR
jgi:hypothetical protein